VQVLSRQVRLSSAGLSSREEQIIAALRANPCADVDYLVTACATSRHSVHNFISRLVARGVVERGGGRGRYRVVPDAHGEEEPFDDWADDEALIEPDDDPRRPWVRPIHHFVRFEISMFDCRRFG
jgi:hypothetical protein